jgi:hypothetical protein
VFLALSGDEKCRLVSGHVADGWTDAELEHVIETIRLALASNSNGGDLVEAR